MTLSADFPMCRTFKTALHKPLPECQFQSLRCVVLSLGADMRRREFIGLVGGSAMAWPQWGLAPSISRRPLIAYSRAVLQAGATGFTHLVGDEP